MVDFIDKPIGKSGVDKTPPAVTLAVGDRVRHRWSSDTRARGVGVVIALSPTGGQVDVQWQGGAEVTHLARALQIVEGEG